MQLINGWEPYGSNDLIGQEHANYIIFGEGAYATPRLLVVTDQGLHMEDDDTSPGQGWYKHWKVMRHETGRNIPMED